ncbi:MAG: hypothetical protein WAV43_06330 [Streptococcus parauberis]
MSERNLEELLKQGYIIYPKNGIIDIVKPPAYGAITIAFQDDKFIYCEKAEKFR